MKIGIIGAGNVGGALGKIWAAKGHDIVFGVRDSRDATVRNLVEQIGAKARAGTVAEAGSFGEIVALATPWPATEEAIRAAGNLSGKIVVDCTNPVKPDLSGLAIGTTTSAGEQVSGWAKGAKVVKAFNTIGAASFDKPRFGSANASMFICSDDAGAKATVAKLAEEMGFDAVDCGPLSNSRWLGGVAILWIDLAVRGKLGISHGFRLLRR